MHLPQGPVHAAGGVAGLPHAPGRLCECHFGCPQAAPERPLGTAQEASYLVASSGPSEAAWMRRISRCSAYCRQCLWTLRAAALRSCFRR
mmetsp:Transcript_73330/g.222116  ORF Transcript_73330/g.222116 Transcript_73330/m.222116 type:complete len:90 (-) Transcript_73330:903-1172(-)